MIKVKNLTKKFGDIVALDNFNMNVEKGSVYGLVGPNGSGKTTIIKSIIGIYKQDSGEIEIGDEDEQITKQDIVYVSDDLYFFPTYTILEMAKFYAGIYKKFDWDTFNSLKEIFNIDTKRKAVQLSKGMKKQVAFWLTISCRPKIMLLDEPIDGLDPIMKKKVWRLLLEDVNNNKTTVIVSSHNLKELEDVCTNLGIIKNGKMELEKSLDKLEGNIHKIQVAFKDNVNLKMEKLKILKQEKNGSIYNLIIKGERQQIERTLKKHNPVILDFIPLNLEEVFIYEMDGDDDEK